MDYIGMHEILELIDKKYNYGQDEESKELMESIPEGKAGKHLIGRKTVLKYMNIWAKNNLGLDEWDNCTYLRVIDTNGKEGCAQKYSKESILSFLEDSNVKQKLQNQLESNTVKMNDSWFLPKCAWPLFLKDIDSQAEKEECLRITGYTKEQMDLYGVPTEVLTEVKSGLETQINELKRQLDDINMVLKYM